MELGTITIKIECFFVEENDFLNEKLYSQPKKIHKKK